MKWFKFYGQDFLTDSKMRILTVEEKMCWIVLMCLAGSEDKEGLLSFVNEEHVMQQAGIKEGTPMWADTKGFIEKFKELNMLEIKVTNVTNGIKRASNAVNYTLKLINFHKRQTENLTNAEKQKNYRERLKITNKSGNNRYQEQSNERYPRRDKNRIYKPPLLKKASQPEKPDQYEFDPISKSMKPKN